MRYGWTDGRTDLLIEMRGRHLTLLVRVSLSCLIGLLVGNALFFEWFCMFFDITAPAQQLATTSVVYLTLWSYFYYKKKAKKMREIEKILRIQNFQRSLNVSIDSDAIGFSSDLFFYHFNFEEINSALLAVFAEARKIAIFQQV